MVFRDSDGEILATAKRYLGNTTNNVAEYEALLTALEEARTHGFLELKIHTDSQLLQRQLAGIYRVKSDHLLPLYRQVKELLNLLKLYDIMHVRREANQEADRLANLAIDEGLKAKQSASEPMA